MKNMVFATVMGIVVMDVASVAVGGKCSISGQACDCSGGQTGILEGLADGKCHTSEECLYDGYYCLIPMHLVMQPVPGNTQKTVITQNNLFFVFKRLSLWL